MGVIFFSIRQAKAQSLSQCCRGLTIAGALDLLTPDDIHDIESLVIIHNPFGNNLARALEAGKTLTPNFCPNDPLRRTPNPEIPASNIQRHVLEAGETSLAAKEGAVHVVGCYADKNRGEWQGICEIVGTSSPSSPGVPEEAKGPATCSANSCSHSP
ncbi:predicted protein [Histoplasma capsulatum G186AR]|uniref:Uncharacterized protein n=1 Tax=Ajellomyces capsulatus (strain G186AR / H82 / ATCC MYA-2454 / RMSCC 2432) TaxID=447093 RepID=C0NSM6_AJECG|nr:uncharacterized protein HCBG_06156 [Histoplasma capsulatum G186AR]EEH05892.1 predicted protein [Histoplasma capsulatum G186AR]